MPVAKKGKSKSSRAAAIPAKKPATARDLGAELGNAIRSAAPDIVNALIDQAKHGNCTPAKFLFDFAGLGSASAADAAVEESLAALLLKELARHQGSGDEARGTVQ
jgi:hypothetical protein